MKLIIDSTVDINSAIKDRFTIVPLTVHFGEEEYIDGVTIDHKQFYEKLIESVIDCHCSCIGNLPCFASNYYAKASRAQKADQRREESPQENDTGREGRR